MNVQVVARKTELVLACNFLIDPARTLPPYRQQKASRCALARGPLGKKSENVRYDLHLVAGMSNWNNNGA